MRHNPRFGLRTLAIITVVVVGAVTLGACSSSDSSNTVHVYSGRHYDLEQAFDQFTEETGIKVEFLSGNDAELRERIEAEGEDTEADVYMTVDAGNLATAAEQGIFQPIESEILDEAIPPALRDPDGLWYGLSVRVRSIVYNPNLVDPSELSTYEDLADPKWKGRLCLRNSANVYTQSLVASLIAEHGHDEALEIVQGWADNAEIMENDVLILESIADEVCDVGITNHYYLAREYADNPDFPVEMVWANQDDRGVHVNISGAGVVKYADQPDLGRQLIEWLATTGQEAFTAGNHEYPANPTVAAEELIATRFGTDFVQDALAAATFGSLNAEAIELMDEAGYS